MLVKQWLVGQGKIRSSPILRKTYKQLFWAIGDLNINHKHLNIKQKVVQSLKVNAGDYLYEFTEGKQ